MGERNLDLIFAALAQPTRRRIVGHLAMGTATVNELVAKFDVSQPTISSHLKVLERSGVIRRSRVAQTRPCELDPEALDVVGAWLGDMRSVYEANYNRLDTVLEQLKDETKKAGRTNK